MTSPVLAAQVVALLADRSVTAAREAATDVLVADALSLAAAEAELAVRLALVDVYGSVLADLNDAAGLPPA